MLYSGVKIYRLLHRVIHILSLLCQHLHCIHFLVLSKQAKTHFVLLINLAVADLIIGFTEPVAIGTVGIPQRFGQEFYGNVSTAFQPQFFSLLAVNGIVDFIHWIVAWPTAVF